MQREPATDITRLRDFVPAILFSALTVATILSATLAAPPKGEMAVVFPPMTSELTAWALVREAGGMIVSPTQLSNIVVAYAPDETFQTRVRALGALFFLTATGLCAPASDRTG